MLPQIERLHPFFLGWKVLHWVSVPHLYLFIRGWECVLFLLLSYCDEYSTKMEIQLCFWLPSFVSCGYMPEQGLPFSIMAALICTHTVRVSFSCHVDTESLERRICTWRIITMRLDRWTCAHVFEAFSYLLIDVGGPISLWTVLFLGRSAWAV